MWLRIRKKTHIEPIRRRDLESPFIVGKTPRTVATNREWQNCYKIYRENWSKRMAVPSEPYSLTSHTKDLSFANDNRWPAYFLTFAAWVSHNLIILFLPEVNVSWSGRIQKSLSCREFVSFNFRFPLTAVKLWATRKDAVTITISRSEIHQGIGASFKILTNR